MRRRRGQRETCSLFAFQDVMASVIGILFFVVILVSLDIVKQQESSAETVTEVPAEGQLEGLRAELQRKQQRRRSLQKTIAGQRGFFERGRGDRADLVRKEIKNLQKEQSGLARQLKEARQRAKDAGAKKGQLLKTRADLKKAIEKAKKEYDKDRKRPPKVVFIIEDRPDALEPWLVEVASTGIRVSPKDQDRVVKTFRAASPEAQRRRFLQWAATQNSKHRYFVLLIKPSGIRAGLRLEQELEAKGFRIGRDLLPENWRTFSDT